MTVKTHRYEIVGWSGDPKETKNRWFRVSDQCREIVNVIWQSWEVWHVQHGSAAKLREFNLRWQKWCNKELDAKPTLDLQPMPKPLNHSIRRELTKRFPDVHSRVRELLQQITTKRMTSKDSEGKQLIWKAVLLNRQGRPNCTHNHPIPFDAASTKPLRRIDEKWTNYALEIRLTRIPSDKKASPSITDTVQLKARKAGHVILGRIVDGAYKFCGSSIVYEKGKRKWYALVAYNDHSDGEGSEVDQAKTAYLLPGKHTPWILWQGTRYEFFGGRGDYVASARRRLLTDRWSRQENYRYAGSSNKGHGRKRAMQGIESLSERWKDFCKTVNHTLSKQIVEHCVDRGIGTLVYLQPGTDKGARRFLGLAGKVAGRRDSTSWDWAQLKTMLAYKCRGVGVHLEVRKCEASGKRTTADALCNVPSGRKQRRKRKAKAVQAV